jgi:hypothetical protein
MLLMHAQVHANTALILLILILLMHAQVHSFDDLAGRFQAALVKHQRNYQRTHGKGKRIRRRRHRILTLSLKQRCREQM